MERTCLNIEYWALHRLRKALHKAGALAEGLGVRLGHVLRRNGAVRHACCTPRSSAGCRHGTVSGRGRPRGPMEFQCSVASGRPCPVTRWILRSTGGGPGRGRGVKKFTTAFLTHHVFASTDREKKKISRKPSYPWYLQTLCGFPLQEVGLSFCDVGRSAAEGRAGADDLEQPGVGCEVHLYGPRHELRQIGNRARTKGTETGFETL